MLEACCSNHGVRLPTSRVSLLGASLRHVFGAHESKNRSLVMLTEKVPDAAWAQFKRLGESGHSPAVVLRQLHGLRQQ